MDEATYYRILAMDSNELFLFASLVMPDACSGDQEAKLIYSLCVYLS